MICEACGVEAPTKYVAFYQNIGVLVKGQYSGWANSYPSYMLMIGTTA